MTHERQAHRRGHRRRDDRPRVGRHQGARTTRCRAGGCGPSTPPSSGPSATRSPIPAWPLLSSATTGRARLFEPRRAARRTSRRRRRRRATCSRRWRRRRSATSCQNEELRALRPRPAASRCSRSTASQCHGTGAHRQHRLPQPQRRRLALGRHARADPCQTISARHPLAHRPRHALQPRCRPSARRAAGADARSTGGEATSPRSRASRAATASPAGEQLFADNCAGCHGERGKGMVEAGAPDPRPTRSGSTELAGDDRAPRSPSRGTA